MAHWRAYCYNSALPDWRDIMPVSKAQQKATAKYEAKAYDKALVRFPKGKLEAIKAHAETHSESVNGFINRAIDETIERDKGAEA